jgi:serine/threonine protein kinase
MAPECVRNKDDVTKASDVWSLGCILYQLLSGLLPFRGASDYLIFRRSTESRYRADLAVIPQLARDLIAKCLQHDPLLRPSIDDLLNDPYFTTFEDQIKTRP